METIPEVRMAIIIVTASLWRFPLPLSSPSLLLERFELKRDRREPHIQIFCKTGQPAASPIKRKQWSSHSLAFLGCGVNKVVPSLPTFYLTF
jgi:hypothetical protein